MNEATIRLHIGKLADGGFLATSVDVPGPAFAPHVVNLTRYEPCLGLSRTMLGLAALAQGRGSRSPRVGLVVLVKVRHGYLQQEGR